jgi:hypothetical protein
MSLYSSNSYYDRFRISDAAGASFVAMPDKGTIASDDLESETNKDVFDHQDEVYVYLFKLEKFIVINNRLVVAGILVGSVNSQILSRRASNSAVSRMIRTIHLKHFLSRTTSKRTNERR